MEPLSTKVSIRILLRKYLMVGYLILLQGIAFMCMVELKTKALVHSYRVKVMLMSSKYYELSLGFVCQHDRFHYQD